MDKTSRDIFILLLNEHLTLWEMQVTTMKSIAKISQGTSVTMRAFGKRMIAISQMTDPAEQEAELESLWEQLDQEKIQNELGRAVARLETQHEKVGAQLQSIVKTLGVLDLD